MVTIFNIHEAKTNLSKIIARVEAGEEICIARDGKPAVRLNKYEAKPLKRMPGGWENLVQWMPGADETDPEMIDTFINGQVFPKDDNVSS